MKLTLTALVALSLGLQAAYADRVLGQSGALDEHGLAKRSPVPSFEDAAQHGPAQERSELALGGRMTNAERFRRGLPPLAPRRLPGGKRSSPSSSPCGFIKQGGVIVASRQDNGNFFGYVSKTYDGQNTYRFTSNINDALRVNFPSTAPFNTLVDITTLNGPDAAHPLLGAVDGSGSYVFGPGSLGYAYIAGTGHSPANSPPSTTAGHSIQSLGYNAPAESQIWTLNCQRDLTAQWVNTDASVHPTTPFYDSAIDAFMIGGDLNKFTQTFPNEGITALTLQYLDGP